MTATCSTVKSWRQVPKNHRATAGYRPLCSTEMSPGSLQTTTGIGRLLAALSALRHRNYRLYWFGQLFSVLAQNMEAVAQSWLVLEMTNSPLLLGLTGLTFSIPTIALTLLGGAVADRTDRKRIMIFSQIGSVMMFSVIGVSGHNRSGGALGRHGACLFLGVRQGLRPAEPDGFVAADGAEAGYSECRRNWRHYLAVEQARRPGAGGHADLSGRHRPTYLFCCAASATAVFLWLGIRLDGQRSTASAGGLLQNMMEGLNFIRKNEIYYTFIGMTFFNSVFGMSYLILMPVFARDILSVGSEGFGFLQSAGGAGALCGALLVAYFGHATRQGQTRDQRRDRFRRDADRVRVFELVFSFACIGVLARRGQPVLHDDHSRDPASQPARSTARARHEYSWTGLGAHARGRHDRGVIAEISSAPSAVAFGGAMVGGMALVVAICLPSIRRLEQ